MQRFSSGRCYADITPKEQAIANGQKSFVSFLLLQLSNSFLRILAVPNKAVFCNSPVLIVTPTGMPTSGDLKSGDPVLKLFWLGYIWRQDVSLQWCKGPKSLLSGRFGYPYGRPGDSFCIRETLGLSGRVGMYAPRFSNHASNLLLTNPP